MKGEGTPEQDRTALHLIFQSYSPDGNIIPDRKQQENQLVNGENGRSKTIQGLLLTLMQNESRYSIR